MVLLSIFYTNQTHWRDHQQIVLYSFVVYVRLLFIYGLNITSNLLYEDLSIVALHIRRLYFPPECQYGPHFVTQPILLSENIPNI